MGINARVESIKCATLEAGLKTVIAKPRERARREIDPTTIKKYFAGLSVINGTPSKFVINIDETGQQEWADKRELNYYIPSDNQATEITYAVDRSGHRSTAVVAISLSGKLLKPMILVKRSTIDTELVELGYGHSALYDTSPTAFATDLGNFGCQKYYK